MTVVDNPCVALRRRGLLWRPAECVSSRMPRPRPWRGSWASTLAGLCALAFLTLPASGYYLIQQRITDAGVKYCGFYDLQRYKAWCADANISAWVASNATCQQFQVCIPLEGYEYMSCSNAPYCSGLRAGAGGRSSQPLPACLVLRSAVNGTIAVCDVEVQGPSLYDTPPPAPPGPPPTERPRRKWALWKTMTIIWSILGFAAFLVILVFLVRYCLRRRAQAVTSSPVTVLSDVAKQQLEQQQAATQQQTQGGPPQQQQPGAGAGAPLMPLLPGGATDMTVTIRPVGPDGKPILAYGASLPAPPPLEALLTANGNGRQLPPNAGDALLGVAAASRDAYNGPPMRTAPVALPPLQGLVGPLPTVGSPVGAVAAGAPGAPLQAVGGGLEAAAPAAGQGLGSGIPAAVTPAALVPPPAATLQNPTASLEATMSPPPPR